MNRGGSWINDARNCRSACRNNGAPGNRDYNQGFRLLNPELRGFKIEEAAEE